MLEFGCIYWLRAEGVDRMKIGFSSQPEIRIEKLRLMSPVALTLVGLTLGSQNEEKELHADLAAYRLHGEWFRTAEPVLASVVPLPLNADDVVTWIELQLSKHKQLFRTPSDIKTLVRTINVLRTRSQEN